MEAGRAGRRRRRDGKGRGRREHAADVFDLLEELAGVPAPQEVHGESDRSDGPGFAELDCPNCGDVVCLADEVLEGGEAVCPNCGELLHTEEMSE